MKAFRLLKADEIECRVSRCSEKGVVLLLYKTARTDADLLDETVDPQNWQNDFKVVDGTLYGGIGIRVNETFARDDGTIEAWNEWVWKWDAGTESNTEAEKGRASDAFKRAGFKWGIGRELYSAPFTFIPAGKCTVKESNGRFQCFDQFEVTDIDYEDEKICYLEISVKDKVVFSWGEPKERKSDLICADCGYPIRDSKKKDGSVWKAQNIAAYTQSFAGRMLCADCGKRAKEALEVVTEKPNG